MSLEEGAERPTPGFLSFWIFDAFVPDQREGVVTSRSLFGVFPHRVFGFFFLGFCLANSY
jgi:hypothetical protein